MDADARKHGQTTSPVCGAVGFGDAPSSCSLGILLCLQPLAASANLLSAHDLDFRLPLGEGCANCPVFWEESRSSETRETNDEQTDYSELLDQTEDRREINYVPLFVGCSQFYAALSGAVADWHTQQS